MPDRNGNRTLRDAFPLTCAKCGQIIQPAKYAADGAALVEEEPYRVIAIRLEASTDAHDKGPIPVSAFGHLACFGLVPAVVGQQFIRRR